MSTGHYYPFHQPQWESHEYLPTRDHDRCSDDTTGSVYPQRMAKYHQGWATATLTWLAVQGFIHNQRQPPSQRSHPPSSTEKLTAEKPSIVTPKASQKQYCLPRIPSSGQGTPKTLKRWSSSVTHAQGFKHRMAQHHPGHRWLLLICSVSMAMSIWWSMTIQRHMWWESTQ